MKLHLALAVILLTAVAARADGIFNDDHPFNNNELVVVADYLEIHSPIPIAWSYAESLSSNLLRAQQAADLDQKDSLDLSELCMIRALGLEKEYGDYMDVVVWDQSNIATDDRAFLTITPTHLDFGNKTVVTPEPGTLSLAAFGLAILVIGAFFRRNSTP